MRNDDINGEWNYDEIICPTCFAVLAQHQDIAFDWRVYATTVKKELTTTTPSGRVWDESKWLWVEATDPVDNTEHRANTSPVESKPKASSSELDEVRQAIINAAAFNTKHISTYEEGMKNLIINVDMLVEQVSALITKRCIDTIRRVEVPEKFDPKLSESEEEYVGKEWYNEAIDLIEQNKSRLIKELE
jgi:hypothetical protein